MADESEAARRVAHLVITQYNVISVRCYILPEK